MEEIVERKRKFAILYGSKKFPIEYHSSEDEKDEDKSKNTLEEEDKSIDWNYCNFPDAQDPDAWIFVSSEDEKDDGETSITPEQDNKSVEFSDAQDPDAWIFVSSEDEKDDGETSITPEQDIKCVEFSDAQDPNALVIQPEKYVEYVDVPSTFEPEKCNGVTMKKMLERKRKFAILYGRKKSPIEYVSSDDEKDDDQTSIKLEQDKKSVDFRDPDVLVIEPKKYDKRTIEEKMIDKKRKLAILYSRKKSSIEYVSSDDEKDDDQTSITSEQDNQSVDFNYSNFPDAQDPDALGFENYDIWS